MDSPGAVEAGAAVEIVAGVNGIVVVPLKKATLCACGRDDGTHYSETVLDKVLPGTPERIRNLMFASGFIKDFLTGNQTCVTFFFLFLRYPNVRLVSCIYRIKAPNQEYVIHQTSNGLS